MKHREHTIALLLVVIFFKIRHKTCLWWQEASSEMSNYYFFSFHEGVGGKIRGLTGLSAVDFHEL